MTHSDPVPSSIRDDSICESSLNPNKSSGGIVELKPCPFCKGFAKIVGLQADQEYGLIKCAGCDLTTDIMPSREELLSFWNTRTSDPESAAEIERLRRAEQESFQKFVDANEARLTAESAVAAAWEEAAKIAEGLPTSVSVFLTKREADAATLTKLDIASAIRAAVSKKTAESGHSPSTHNSESE